MTGSAQYKKSWLIITKIAREMICYSVGDRLPTIQEYTERYGSSRGIVQNAMHTLRQEGAIVVETRGKTGSFLMQMDLPKLFDLADIQYIIGSMAPPLNPHIAALATGVCAAISCPVTFNFAFMHSSQNRAKALQRMIYDFVIVSLHSAKQLVERYEELEVVMTFQDSLYDSPFSLYTNTPGVREITDGASVAVDPNSNDQYDVTMKLCEGKDVNIIHAPYVVTGAMFQSKDVDFVAMRLNEMAKFVEQVPIEAAQNLDMTIPAVLINRNNYGMDRILRKYLKGEIIADVQSAVLAGRKKPEFY